ncbi:hypothetical protein HDU93_001298 [Gonapodya sp. JEL0774]|nr:hypothetical protein HDU93_001298 [Gonapodya sp. JEL0774]
MADVATPEPRPSSHRKGPARPDQDAYNALMNEINQRIEDLKKKLGAIRESLGNNDNNKGKTDSRRQELRNQLSEIRKQQQEIRNSRTKILDKLKDVRNNIKRKTDEIKSAKDKLQFRSLADIDRQVRALEAQLESQSHKLIEEKRLVQEISQLKKARKVVETFSGQQEGLDEDKRIAEELSKQLEAFDPQRAAFEEQYTALSAQIAALDKDKEVEFSRLNEIYNERNAIQKELETEFNRRKEVQEAFRKQKEEFYNHLQEERKRKAEEAKRRQLEYKRERLAAEAERERELAEIPAFQDEINTLSNLITFFQQYVEKPEESPATSATNGSPSSSQTASPARGNAGKVDGGKLLKSKADRMDEDLFFLGKAKGSTSKKRSGGPKVRQGPLKLDMAVMESLFKEGIDPPAGYDQVEETVKSLTEKKTHYLESQAKQTEENKRKAEEKIRKLRAEMEADKDEKVVVEPEPAPAVVEKAGYAVEILQDSHEFAAHAGRTEVKEADVKLAVDARTSHSFTTPPTREVRESIVLTSAMPCSLFTFFAFLTLPHLASDLVLASLQQTSSLHTQTSGLYPSERVDKKSNISEKSIKYIGLVEGYNQHFSLPEKDLNLHRVNIGMEGSCRYDSFLSYHYIFLVSSCPTLTDPPKPQKIHIKRKNAEPHHPTTAAEASASPSSREASPSPSNSDTDSAEDDDDPDLGEEDDVDEDDGDVRMPEVEGAVTVDVGLQQQQQQVVGQVGAGDMGLDEEDYD